MALLARLAAHALIGLAAVLLLAGVAGLAHAERESGDFLLGSAINFFLAGGLLLATSGHPLRWTRSAIIVTAGTVWIVTALSLSAVLTLAVGMPIADAVFEATSMLSTTGASVLSDPDRLPRSILLSHALSGWYGGALTLATAVLVLAPTGSGGFAEPHTALGHHVIDFEALYGDCLRHVLPIYAGATFACALLLSLAGVPALEAICLAAATISTTGYGPRADGPASYGSAIVMGTVAVFMLVGATSIVVHRLIVAGRWKAAGRGRENLNVMLLVVLFAVVIAVVFAMAGSSYVVPKAVFTAISLVSTTGYAPTGELTIIPLSLVTLAVFVGGATLSTAGGMKVYRVAGMAAQSARELRRLLYPHGIRPAHLGGEPYSIQSMKAVWTAAVLWLSALALVLVLVSFDHPDFAGAYVASLAALSNTGPIYVSGWSGEAPWPSWANFTPWTKLILAGAMIVGRVEVVLAAVLANLALWRR